jgi:hypothetical protein
MPADIANQHARFVGAVDAIGGQREAARLLNCGERTIRDLVSGARPLHKGWLTDISAALVAHATHCRALEKQLNPLYADNLTPAQMQEKPDGRRKAPAALNGGTPGRGEWGDWHG